MTPALIMSVLLCPAARVEMELAEAQWEQPSLELDQQPTNHTTSLKNTEQCPLQ